MKYRIKHTNIFKKDYKRIIKRGYDINRLNAVIDKLASGEKLGEIHKDHELTGNYKGYRECHITPDWLLVYRRESDILVLVLSRTGSHSDIF